MHYRMIPRLGAHASIIGFGGEHMLGRTEADVFRTIDYAIGRGINIFDLFWPQADFRNAISKAFRGRRDSLILQGHIGTVMVGNQYSRSRNVALSRKYFEDFLRRFHTDYVDIGMMHFVDTMADYEEAFESDFIRYVEGLKRDGKVRCIGVSCHTASTAMRMIDTGLIDVLMFSINAAFDVFPKDLTLENAIDNLAFRDVEQYSAVDEDRMKLYRLCEEKGIAITVMKTYGGKLLLFDETSPFGKKLSPAQCIEYALSRPGVVSALIGCKTPEEVDTALHYLDAAPEERDYSQITNSPKYRIHGKCVYCGHCSPCPQGITVADVTKYLDMARDFGEIPATIAGHYWGLSHTAEECISCGQCERRCPFGVKIIDNMKQAKEIFGPHRCTG